MNVKNSLILGLITAGLTSSVLAADLSKTYFEVGYSAVGIEGDDTVGIPDVDLNAISFAGGTELTDYLNVGFAYTNGLGDETIQFLGVDVDVQLNSVFSAYLEPKMNVSDDVEIFGRVGYYAAEIEASALGVSETDDINGLTYGVGLKFNVSDKLYISPSYLKYDDEDSGANVMNISLGMRF